MAKKVTLPKKPAAEKKQATVRAKKVVVQTPAVPPVPPVIPIVAPKIPIVPEIPPVIENQNQSPEIGIGSHESGIGSHESGIGSHESGIGETNGIKEPRLCVVIPYIHQKASGDELLYALRAWAQNLPGVQIVLVGDKPDFVSDEVLHIPGLTLGDNPQIDVATKLMQAIASDLVPNSFILSNDDIYPIAPVELADLIKWRCAGSLGDKKNATSGYLQKTLATKDILSKSGLPCYDYGTHLPVVYEKSSLAEVLEKYNAEKIGLLISSLYFNSVFPNQVPEITKGNSTGQFVAYIYRENPDPKILAAVFNTRKFINHNSAGYAPTLPFLKKYFPDKSKFEK